MKRQGELFILDGLEGNPRADVLTSSQEFLSPYVPLIEWVYTILFFGTLLFLFTKFVFLPLVQQKKSST